ncbi:MAG: hypothetical protein ACRCXQ_14935 [Vagococcus fluvialis]
MAEQLDCMQKSLCYILLADDGQGKKVKKEPTLNDIWTLRENTHQESKPNKGKAPRRHQKLQADSSKVKKTPRWESVRDQIEDEDESSDPQTEFNDSDSESEEDYANKKLLLPKPRIDLSLMAAVARQERGRNRSDSEEEAGASQPRRGPARRAKKDSITSIQLLQNMKFPGANNNLMTKAKMVAKLGETLNVTEGLIEQMITYHTGLSLPLETLNAHLSQVIGIDEEAEFRKEVEMIKNTGLWPYLSGKAKAGGSERKMLNKLKKIAVHLPGCREIASWGAETDWSEMSKFAARYDRETNKRQEMKDSPGREKSKPTERSRNKQRTSFQKPKTKFIDRRTERHGNNEPPKTEYKKPKQQTKPVKTKNAGKKREYIEPEKWAKMSEEQKKAHMNKRNNKVELKIDNSPRINSNSAERDNKA